MDPRLIREAARMTMLRYGLERQPDATGPFNISVRDVVLWRLLKEQVAHLELEEMREALEDDPHVFVSQRFTEEALVDGVYSRGGYQFYSARVSPSGHNAKRADYEAMLVDWNAKPRPAVAVFQENEVALTTSPVTVALSNHGFGGPQALVIEGVDAPSWVRVEQDGYELKLSSLVHTPGVYHGVVRARTNGGTAQVVVTAERLDFPEPTSEYVVVDSFFEEAAGLDVAATRTRVEEYLTTLGYELLPGGAAVELEVRPAVVETIRVKLERTYLLVGEVPLPHRVDPRPTLVDEQGYEPGYDVTYTHGILSGLRDLFVDYEAKPGHYLVLRLRSDGYEFGFEEPNPLLETHGYRYWLLGTAAALNQIPDWKRMLHVWITEGEVNVLVRNWEENAFTRTLSRLHASGTISVKRYNGSFPTVVIVEGENHVALDPIQGKLIQLSTDPEFLWRQADFLEGRNVRDEAQNDTASNGLTLPLSPEQRKLADLLSPMGIPEGSPAELLARLGMLEPRGTPPQGSTATRTGSDGWWFTDPDLYTRLLRLSTAFRKEQPETVGRSRFLPAKKYLTEYGVTADQVNYFDRPIRVTRGGWLVADPTAMNLTQLAEAVASLTSEPLHHSQLRQICEAFLGSPIDPSAFLRASLYACGWAGPGYRRAKIKNEPEGTNLNDVVCSLLRQGYLKRHEVILAARRFLRVSPEKIAQTYDAVVRVASAAV